jgi:hypothetical protein
MRAQEFETVPAEKILRYVKKIQGDGHFYVDHLITRYPQWKLVQMPLSKLKINPDPEIKNPLGTNIHVDLDYVSDIKPQDIARKPIVADPSGWIIDGNHRATAAAEAGLASIPAYVPVKQDVAEVIPQPGPSSGAPKQFGPDAEIQTRQMTAKDIIKSVPGVPYYNNVIDDWDAKDYSWGVTKKVIEYATYLKQHPETLSKLPPAIVLNGKFEDGAHRVSALWLLQQRMDPKNPLWANAKLNVQFVKQGVTENFADGKVKGKSRPGRVKRSGASCAGSVTDLRAKAKKYGGEKGKMYHWCANMKSGKKK